MAWPDYPPPTSNLANFFKIIFAILDLEFHTVVVYIIWIMRNFHQFAFAHIPAETLNLNQEKENFKNNLFYEKSLFTSAQLDVYS